MSVKSSNMQKTSDQFCIAVHALTCTPNDLIVAWLMCLIASLKRFSADRQIGLGTICEPYQAGTTRQDDAQVAMVSKARRGDYANAWCYCGSWRFKQLSQDRPLSVEVAGETAEQCASRRSLPQLFLALPLPTTPMMASRAVWPISPDNMWKALGRTL